MESTNPTLLEAAPRTGVEAIDRILDGLEKGRTGVAAEYCYEANGVCCPIGFLLTSEQRQQISQAGLQRGPLKVVAEMFGRQNIEAMTGMRLEIAQRLQRDLDAQPSDEAVKEVLLAFREENERVLSRPNPYLPGNEAQGDPEPLEDEPEPLEDEPEPLEDEPEPLGDDAQPALSSGVTDGDPWLEKPMGGPSSSPSVEDDSLQSPRRSLE
jgi:hypothetical protein